MKIKKQIKRYYDSIQLPSAKNVLPETARVPVTIQSKKSNTKLIMKFATATLCLLIVTASLAVGLNRPDKEPPIIDVSEIISKNENTSFGAENPYISDNESTQTNESDIYKPDESNISGEHNIFQPPYISEPDDPNVSNTESNIPSEVLTVYANKVAGEFAADMYRPEGYDEKIGSTLAIMMSMNEVKETKFNVLVHTYDTIDLKALLLQTVSSVEAITVEINGEFAGTAYYVQLTDAQIKELTKYGLKCCYIGSGLGDYKDINWETEEGKRTYCEIWGDMYTFNQRSISYHPDIFPEEEN